MRHNPPSVVRKELKVFIAATGVTETVMCFPDLTVKGVIQSMKKEGLNLMDHQCDFGILREKDGSWLKDRKKVDSINFEPGVSLHSVYNNIYCDTIIFYPYM